MRHLFVSHLFVGALILHPWASPIDASASSTVSLEHESQVDRPNIIFFLVDDQRFDQLGCAGNPIVLTPNIDSLAAKGLQFKNAFVTTSICAASRATLFSGQVELTHGYTFGKPAMTLAQCRKSYPAILRSNGYRTGFVGKFGVKVEKGSRDAMFDDYKEINRTPYFKKTAKGPRHTTELCTEHAIKFLNAMSEKPFCLQVSFNAAHAEDNDKENHFPWPKAMDGMYDETVIPEPTLAAQAIFDSQPEFLKTSLNRTRYFWRWDTPQKYQKNMRAYYRMISGIDKAIGQVLAEVEELGIAKQTVIIFSSDNGYYMGQRGFAGKWSHYDESLRIPLIIHVPGLKHSHDSDKHLVLNLDIPTTMLDLARIKKPRGFQGETLLPLLTGEKVDWREDFFCEHRMVAPGRIPQWEGVRSCEFTYAVYTEQKPRYEFLHDLKADASQLKNLANDQNYRNVLEKMRARCETYRRQFSPLQKKDSEE